MVGPEDPLVNGVRDFFEQDQILKSVPVIGQIAKGAQLEGSKDFSKEFMFRHNIPTAKYKTFHEQNLDEGYTFLETLKAPYVLKADGLAAGKGVLILEDLENEKLVDIYGEMLNNCFYFNDGNSTKRAVDFIQSIQSD